MIIRKEVIRNFGIEKNLFDNSGKLVFPDFQSLRNFIKKINQKREIHAHPERAFKSGELNGILTIENIFDFILENYKQEISPKIYKEAVVFLKEKISEATFNKIFSNFKKNFRLIQDSEENILENIILNWLSNSNPAFKNYSELFDNSEINIDEQLQKLMKLLIQFFEQKPKMDNENLNLLEFLQKPAKKSSRSIRGQLKYIRDNWGSILGNKIFLILKALDLLKEEEKFGLPGPGPSIIHEFDSEDEYERFTRDKDWMPNLVLIAKNTLVWLDQLSKKYKKTISKLDEIPEEELELYSRRGFSGIWLIGIWERSFASKRIKQKIGIYDAEASAYSIKSYNVAHNLGGDQALENLKAKAAKYSIRIGCDMVPNHTGIDSDWIYQHPDWFIQLDHAPFPAYSFNGENLSNNQERVIQIEDHYYDKTDAAVVFKLYDRKNHRDRFIYHGNDGTSFPWNDTAQLNYLLPEVRESVIRQIVGIAKKFPIIRFDAAMTLAKKHYQRLWFPEPGTGGDIPSRTEHGMSRQEFNECFPEEFWRQVVDRIAVEAPDTLLLAEAFWLMEGYFVRTLGMHRVYNSAFMNMLKNEENDKFKQSIYNVVKFNPEILKRFVNFMSNPDEDTAIFQFGKEDKYFGTCVLMCTLPGLPMFAHGQIEGFTERYGMEFSQAKLDEKEDIELIQRHEREIFPFLRRRYLFAEVHNFVLFDFVNEQGEVNHNVITFFNENFNEKILVIFHNKYEHTSGKIKWGYSKKQSLGTLLNLKNDSNYFVIFKERISNLEFIHNSKNIIDNGLQKGLRAFQHEVILDFREVEDNQENDYRQLCDFLNGQGVPSIEYSLKRFKVKPILDVFSQVFTQDLMEYLINLKFKKKFSLNQNLEAEILLRINRFLTELRDLINGLDCIESIIDLIKKDLEIWFKIKNKNIEKDSNYVVLFWIFLKHIGLLNSKENFEVNSKELFNELLFADEIKRIIEDKTPFYIHSSINEQIIFLIENQNLLSNSKNLNAQWILNIIFDFEEINSILKLNEFDNKTWFNKEAFEYFLNLFYLTNYISLKSKGNEKGIVKLRKTISKIKEAEEKSEYQVEKLLKMIQSKKGQQNER